MVSFPEVTPFGPDTEFTVRIHHSHGEEIRRIRPEQSRAIGIFDFSNGMDGFVEIHAENARGLVAGTYHLKSGSVFLREQATGVNIKALTVYAAIAG